MFWDLEFLPEMLSPDKAVYELFGVNFEDTTKAGDAARCRAGVVMERESQPISQ